MVEVLSQDCLLSIIFSFLDHTTLIRMARINSHFYRIINIILKTFIQRPSHHYPHKWFQTKEQKFMKMYNFYFARRVFSSNIESLDPPKLLKIKDSSVLNYHEGPNFSAFLSREQTLKACLTEDPTKKFIFVFICFVFLVQM